MSKMAEDFDIEEAEIADEPEIDIEDDEVSEADAETDADSDVDGDEAEVEEPDTEDEGDLIVTIGEGSPDSDDEDTANAPEWVKKLRKQQKETARENKELKRQLEARQTAETKPAELRKKPTLEDHDFDADAFEVDLLEWNYEKTERDTAEKVKAVAQKHEQAAWQAKLGVYAKATKALAAKDFEEVEDDVKATLSMTQQAIIVEVAENPALTVYALGKNEAELKRLAEIKNPIAYAAEVVRLEAKMKTSRRKPTTEPERRVKGAAPAAGGSNLKKLHEQAQKTGDWTAYLAAKRAAKS